jgi:uncharacterized protein
VTSFSLRSLKLRPGEAQRERHDVKVDALLLGGQRYLPVPGTVPSELTVTRTTSGTLFELRLSTRFHGPCYRCLTDAVVDESISAREYQASSPGPGDDLRTPYLRDDVLDLSTWARDALVLALPEKILCRPDCAGLCPVCGRDRNAEPHEHEEESLDPRWAALAELKDRL